mgnify:CR=1 FL=1
MPCTRIKLFEIGARAPGPSEVNGTAGKGKCGQRQQCSGRSLAGAAVVHAMPCCLAASSYLSHAPACCLALRQPPYPRAADAHHDLFVRLQLGTAALIELHKEKDVLTSKDGRQALGLAVRIHAKELLAQPGVQEFVRSTWLGDWKDDFQIGRAHV